MLQLGLAQGHVSTDPDDLTPVLAREIAALGVTRITTHFEVSPDAMAGPRGERVAGVLADSGIRISQCAGFRPNLVSPNATQRADDIAGLADLMRSARSLDAEMVLFGCGSLHPTFPYGSARENHLPETRARLVESLREVARRAEDTGILAAIECHVLTTLDTPEHVHEIVGAVDSPWLRVNFDPINFLDSPRAVYDSGAVLRHAGEILASQLAPSAHIKDVVIEPDLVVKVAEVPAGQGIVDLEALIETCGRYLPEGGALIVEHFGPAESEVALRDVAAIARRLGLLAAD